MDSEIREINIEDLIPFKYHSGQMYEDERLQSLMDSIKKVGMMNPIIVRPAENGKYEILCGHNRVKALRALEYDSVKADIRYGMSDDNALEMFYDSNLNQQSFTDWNYSQRINAVKYIERLISEKSRQGKRTDLEKKSSTDTGDKTCVQGRHKLNKDPKRVTARDKMARRFGISTATLSKYRRIIKLPDDLLESIAKLLDDKRITFEAAYIISSIRDCDIKELLKEITQYPDKKLDLEKLKKLPHRNTENTDDAIYPISKKQVQEVLISPPTTGTISPIHEKSI